MQTYTQKLVDAGILKFKMEYEDSITKNYVYIPKLEYRLILDHTIDDYEEDIEDDALIRSITEVYIDGKFIQYLVNLNNLEYGFHLKNIEDYITIFKKI